MKLSTGFIAAAAFAAGLSALFVGAQASSNTGPIVIVGAETTPATYFATLPSLAGAHAPASAGEREDEDAEIRRGLPSPVNVAGFDDGALQASAAPAAPTTAGLGFDGVSAGAGGTPSYAPPDTTGAVGATQYVQWTNVTLAVYDKTTGTRTLGPVLGSTLFQNLGGPCAVNDDGDPIVQYDKAAQRWVVSQFSVTDGDTAGYWECVAVSQTSDATGAWNLYAFQYSQFNDYPKMGVWPDGYYTTFNMFGATSFAGARMCAYDRTAMLAGSAATQQCFQLSSIVSVLPADLDGSTAPPANSPNYMLTRGGTSSLAMYKFHTDWTTPGSSTLTGPFTIPVASYSMACRGGACIVQPNTRQKLDSLADRLMFRLAYRNISGVERMVVNHSVAANRASGVRWYEIRGMATTPAVFQQGTYAPDSSYRWMGSAAMDKQGNMAVGYSFSSSRKFPGLAYATRLASDAAGTLGAETVIINGGGSQSGNRLDRWGDYTHMSIDPVDDCTFWYVGQYLKTTGSYNWTTRITSFKLSACS